MNEIKRNLDKATDNDGRNAEIITKLEQLKGKSFLKRDKLTEHLVQILDIDNNGRKNPLDSGKAAISLQAFSSFYEGLHKEFGALDNFIIRFNVPKGVSWSYQYLLSLDEIDKIKDDLAPGKWAIAK